MNAPSARRFGFPPHRTRSARYQSGVVERCQAVCMGWPAALAGVCGGYRHKKSLHPAMQAFLLLSELFY